MPQGKGSQFRRGELIRDFLQSIAIFFHHAFLQIFFTAVTGRNTMLPWLNLISFLSHS